MNAAALSATHLIMNAIVEAVEVAGDDGVPETVVAAAMMQEGCQPRLFNEFLGALVETGRLRRKDGRLYFLSHLPPRMRGKQ